jgi:hypothetical protein
VKKRIGIGLVLALLASLAVVGVAGAWGPSPYCNGYCSGGYYYQSYYQGCYQPSCCGPTYYGGPMTYGGPGYFPGPAYDPGPGYNPGPMVYGGVPCAQTYYGGGNYYYAGMRPW